MNPRQELKIHRKTTTLGHKLNWPNVTIKTAKTHKETCFFLTLFQFLTKIVKNNNFSACQSSAADYKLSTSCNLFCNLLPVFSQLADFCTCICSGFWSWHDFTCPTAINALSHVYIINGGGDSSVVRAPDSWLKGRGFESLLERRENFLLQGRLSVLTLISVSVPPPCYRSST